MSASSKNRYTKNKEQIIEKRYRKDKKIVELVEYLSVGFREDSSRNSEAYKLTTWIVEFKYSNTKLYA